MIIDQLPLLSGDLQSTDEIPIERGTTTYKTTVDKITVPTDATPTQGSTNPVQSGGVYTALQTKQNALTFDSSPTQGSSNPVTSGGIYDALRNVSPTGLVSYAEAQTLTAAQQKQARDNIGAEQKWQTLWSNASSTSNFDAQTISLDLTNYNMVKILFKRAAATFVMFTEETIIQTSMYVTDTFYSGGSNLFRTRSVDVTNSGVTFGHCMQNDTVQLDGALVPYRIYAR